MRTESVTEIKKNDKPIDKKLSATLFSKKEAFYYKMIDRFFKDCTEEQIVKMLNIINKESEISLRILDWFVTRHSKKKIDFDLNNDEIFDVHISYKAQLKSYKKTYFDPFRRRKKFYYNYDKNNTKKQVYTTIGQLNFFRWAISNNIIEYVEKNLTQLTKAMNSSNKEDKKKKQRQTSSDDDGSDYSDSDDSSTDETPSSRKKQKITVEKKKHKNKINMTVTENIMDDEVQIILNFD